MPPPLPNVVETPPVQLALPPVPDLPALAKGQTPPAAVIGVLGVPEIMRASTAAQQVQQVLGERREKLNEDAQKEQAAWRELQEQLSNPRTGMTPDQIRERGAELQARIAESQRRFRDRNRQIEDAGQFALAQIERTLIGVINQVATSRGMNLILHRTQVALNANDFDITQAVTEQLNKVLPQVKIPGRGHEHRRAAGAAAGDVLGRRRPKPARRRAKLPTPRRAWCRALRLHRPQPTPEP